MTLTSLLLEKSLFQHQRVSFTLAHMAANLELARWITYRAAHGIDSGELPPIMLQLRSVSPPIPPMLRPAMLYKFLECPGAFYFPLEMMVDLSAKIPHNGALIPVKYAMQLAITIESIIDANKVNNPGRAWSTVSTINT
ncbi:unnamed protein product [Gongylonema pulchrum]|uniref:Acyl-CoA_dh_1 domain-containing protein n=1 Tax=Gongylonema pulchrum TaxID=637853 RepID=A0A183DZB5_9BILA|nr:unnamed protein product [Gongylonema pulchrum]